MIVSGCSLPEQLVILQGSCNRVHREELADDRLVFHQLQCGVGGDLDPDGNKYIPGLEPAAKVAYLASVLPFALSHGERGKVVYGGKEFIKMGILTLLDPLHFAPRRGRDHGGEGSVQAAAVPRLGVMVPLVPLGLRLPLLPPCVGVAGLGRRTFRAAGTARAVGAAGSGAASG